MKLKFRQKTDTEVEIIAVKDDTEHVVGEIFTPSGSSHDTPDSIQVCGFSEAFELWGCAVFGQPTGKTLPAVEMCPGFVTTPSRPEFKQVKDIQLKFEWETVQHFIRGGLDPISTPMPKCIKCYNEPCTCESHNPYSVKDIRRE